MEALFLIAVAIPRLGLEEAATLAAFASALLAAAAGLLLVQADDDMAEALLAASRVA